MAFSLGHLLAVAADRTPDRTAVVDRGAQYTYGQLYERASSVGRLLLDNGVRRGDRVAILHRRSFDCLAAIYGTMLAGAAYVPLDSGAPPNRLGAVLQDCDVRHVVCGRDHIDDLRSTLVDGHRVHTVLGAEPADELAVANPRPWSMLGEYESGSPLRVKVVESDLSLIFYTSGSTGNPKGVAHSHRSMLANVDWAELEFGVWADDRVPHVTSHHFDLSWFEMFVTSAVSAALVMVPENVVGFPPELGLLVESERLSVWCSVPSVLVGLVQRGDLPLRDLSALRLVLFAGERFPVKHLRTLMAQVPQPRYVNMYGTTETHIAAFLPLGQLDNDDPLPIGAACAHVELGIVSADGTPVPDGETGELVIRGPSLMDQYWNLEERTARALRPEHFADGLFDVVYHTGDLVRRRPDGNIEITGRGDRRVKVQGNLVDLDEIESVLLTHSAVLEAASFLASEQDGYDARIVAAVRLAPSADAAGSALRVHVAATLPVSAVPEVVEILDDFPRTGSGKISRNDLARVVHGLHEERRAGRTTAGRLDGPVAVQSWLRTVLAQIANDPSEVERAAPDDDLFQAGIMDSMGVVELVTCIEEQFAVAVPNDQFVARNFSTLAAITALIDSL